MKRGNPDWLSKQETADALSVSSKTIERWTSAGRLHPVMRKRAADNRRELGYDPAEVAKLKGRVQPPPPSGAHTAALSVIAGLLSGEQGVPIAERLMLTEDQAALLAGVPAFMVETWRKEGKLFALRTNAGWRYRRSDLGKIIESLA